jgi:hypothetical protein
MDTNGITYQSLESAAQCLRRARESLKDESSWYRGDFIVGSRPMESGLKEFYPPGQDYIGVESPLNAYACDRLSLYGAIVYHASPIDFGSGVQHALKVIRDVMGGSYDGLVDWNNTPGRTHQEVLDLLEIAVMILESQAEEAKALADILEKYEALQKSVELGRIVDDSADHEAKLYEIVKQVEAMGRSNPNKPCPESLEAIPVFERAYKHGAWETANRQIN